MKIIFRTSKIYILIGICVCIFYFISINSYSQKVDSAKNKQQSNISVKCKKTYEDLLLLLVRLGRWESYIDFPPFPDWIVDAPFAVQKSHGLVHFLEEVQTYYPQYSKLSTYSERLQYFKTEPDNLYIMNHYKLLTIGGGQPKFTLADISTRTIDPFNPGHGQYEYNLTMSIDTLAETYDFFIFRSNGPDEDIDIDVKELNTTPPNYGLPKPIIEYAYDPTNGTISNGDIFIGMFFGDTSGIYRWQYYQYQKFTGKEWPGFEQWKKWMQHE